MSGVWDGKMRALLYVLLLAACVLGDKNDNRRNKLPFVADAVGNSLPPPSSVPATVGSPVNLLTPDRYEFYTFDESGELVKKLMTLEEIQAIVAAGEEGDGLVTFANDNQPTIAFNFSQPPYTKVHSVVTNVQNVLKAQMEAQKNQPHFQPTLDTPDVSDTWSLILPSIFGNTGVDINPDKSSGTFTTPETETFDVDTSSDVEDNYLSKEGDNQLISSSTTEEPKAIVTEKIPPTLEVKEVSTSTYTTTTTTTSTTTTSTTPKLTTTTTQPTTTMTPHPTTSTTTQPTTSTTTQPTTATPPTKKPSTTNKPSTTTRQPPTRITNKPRYTTTTAKPSTTLKPIVRTTAKTTTTKPEIITKAQYVNTSINKNTQNNINVQIQPNFNSISSTEKNEIQFEKLSTFIPVSTINYVTQRTTTTPSKPTTTKPPIMFASTTKRSVITAVTTTRAPLTQIATSQPSITTVKPALSTFSYISSTFKDPELEKVNTTTLTTQSVSPSTTISSTENLNLQNSMLESKPTPDINKNDDKDSESMLPLFDVAQSISQIASDLGGNYQPIPTTSNLLDTTKVNVMDLESKENLDIDIPLASGNDTEIKVFNTTDNNVEKLVKISTLDPHAKNESKDSDAKEEIKTNKDKSDITVQTVQKIEITTVSTEETTIDPILSESMGDLLSQVVNEAPQSIVDSEESSEKDIKITTTEKYVESTTIEDVSKLETTSEPINVKKETTSTTTEFSIDLVIVNQTSQPSVADIFTTNNITKNIETDVVKTEITSKPDNNSVSNKHEEPKSPDNTEENADERGEVNFVEIEMFTNKNVSKDDIEPITTETRFGAVENNTQMKEEEKQNTPEEMKTVNKKNKLEDIATADIETSTPIFVTKATTTTVKPIIENKFSPAKFNKINSGDKLSASSKKDRIPEPLPKVDDFKKKIQKVNIAEEELINARNHSWKLVPTLSPPKVNEIQKDKPKAENHYTPENDKEIILEYSQENQGLEVTTRDLGEDIAQFTELCNELAFRYWNVIVANIDKRRSFVISPYSITSMLAMMFMGAKGATSGEMNEILKLDDMVTFNPHFTLKNISDSIETTTNSGIAVSAFIRELYSDRNKGKILTFYKERAQHFYNGHVEEINFKLISDIIRRRTNLLVKRYTWGKIAEYMKTNNIVMQPPLAAFSANIFQTDCTGTSVDGRDGEMYFVVSPNVRQRRLVPVPAVVYKYGFLAGYDPVLDATAAALGNTNSIISTLFLMPGQQGNVVHADDLEKLEQRLLDTNPTTPTWNRLLRTLLPRTGLELQIPRFSHKSIFNVSSTLQKMGLKDLFDADHADLGGLNGPSKDLFLSDMIQFSTFVTCGEGVVGEQHHIEEYPETLAVAQRRRTSRWVNDWDEPRDYQRAFHDPHDVGDAMHLPLHLRPRQARVPSRTAQPARLKYDRPFLYFVRHNPSGMILYFGRYNPRLLP